MIELGALRASERTNELRRKRSSPIFHVFRVVSDLVKKGTKLEGRSVSIFTGSESGSLDFFALSMRAKDHQCTDAVVCANFRIVQQEEWS